MGKKSKGKAVYLLEKTNGPRFVIAGVFRKKSKAEKKIKDMPAGTTFILTKLPLDKFVLGPELEDNLGGYDHWHYPDEQDIE